MKKLLALVVALSMTLSLAACGGADSSTPASTGGTSTPASETGEGETGGRTFGCVVFASTAQSSQREAEAFTEYVEAQGDEAIVLYAEGDLQKMLDCVDDLVSRDVDGIIMQMVTSEPPVSMFEELQAAGIPVALMDGAATNVTEEDGYVVSETIY